MHDTDKPLVWLIVGGAPRSGTTALGEALGQSKDIAIFHEYLSHRFFAAIESFFLEEDRQSKFQDFPHHAHLVPTRAAHGRKFARSIFRDVFPEKSAPLFIGTKSPSYEEFAVPKYPDWITPRIIHITRNPFDVTLSSLKKDMHEEKIRGTSTMEDLHDRLRRWVSAWNYAVQHADDKNFLHIFYDDLLEDSVTEKRRVVSFLDGVRDFDFSEFKPTQTQPVEQRYSGADMAEYLTVIKSVAPIKDWLQNAKEKFRRREKIGFPLSFGSSIDLSLETRDSGRYVQEGFYPPEADGSWTKGNKNTLLFSPLGFSNRSMQLSFEMVWSANTDQQPRDIEVLFNGLSVFRKSINLGSKNGTGRIAIAQIPGSDILAMQTCTLTFIVHNPCTAQGRNKAAGKRNDARELGIMIRRIVFSDETPRKKLFSFW